MVYYRFNEDQIVRECCSKERIGDTKKLTHAAIVVNNLVEGQQVSTNALSLNCVLQDFEEQMVCLQKVVNWLILTRFEQVTIYDAKGLLQNTIQTIAKGAKKDKNKFVLQVGEKRKVTINFINEQDNKQMILEKVQKRSVQLKKEKKFEKIANYDKYEKEVYKHTEELPNLILAFNSKRRVLKMPGFPCLLKETAEILECGPLNTEDFRAIEFVQCIEKYASIE